MLKEMTLAVAFLFPSLDGFAAAVVGKQAPDFTITDVAGKEQKLSAYAGKWVVLEWFNQGCPYVMKQYESKAMQKTQKESTGKGAVWLTIVSSKKGKQGYLEKDGAELIAKKWGMLPTAMLLDTEGKIGNAYGAKTTPHMFVISPDQKVAYAGAIDADPTPRGKVSPSTKNYVAQALAEGMETGSITVPNTKPYGCNVKY